MHFKSTVQAAISSYLGIVTSIVTGLLSIRLATRFLSTEEFGLWGFTMQTVGYLLLLDLGVSSSVARLFGEPLASGDPRKADAWFTLSLLTLALQALLILGIGWFLCPHVLHWFNIPAHLQKEASQIWIACLAIRSVSLISSLSFAILHAQNRVYWSNTIQALGTWGGLGAFALMLWQHWGVMAYAWSAGCSAAICIVGAFFAVRRGGHRFHLTFSGVTRSNLRHLFGFSSSVFVLGLATQVYFASQTLVATKLLGLEAAAILTVTSRSTSIAISSIWKPFDSFSPRWQVAYCADDLTRVAREFSLMTRFTILITATAAAVVALVNQPFILWWTKPEYFGGVGLTLMLCGFILVQGVNRCFCTLFPLTLRMRKYAAVNLISVVVAIVLMVVLTRWMGLVGIPTALILTDLLYPTWHYLRSGPVPFKVNGLTILIKDMPLWIPVLALAAAGSLFLQSIRFPSHLIWLLSALACSALCTFPLVWRAIKLIRQLRDAS